MLKKLCIAGLFMTFSTIIYSQDISFGPKLGLNYSNISGHQTDGFSPRIGFNAGFMAEFSLTDKFSIQPEVLYSTQGADAEDDYFAYYEILQLGNVQVKTDYINVPVLAEYYITPNLSVQLGPQVGFLVNSALELDLEYEGEQEFRSNGLENQLHKVDFAISGGFEYALDSGIFFDIRYNLGMTDFVLAPDGGLQGNNKNRVVQLSAGYSF
ncbi:porin family protein [Christiangramia sp. SM2212]|uniref:Porin family protein n=1 Tax=Christiangramia sediminicola TaxID=3073267 RepID=A0ABU1EUE7_9FLAO|nr:porin family protein [Christiangramia sp. SM2212]MDR5592019.1 porin family protein [Christiangramia sp. SM2212]